MQYEESCHSLIVTKSGLVIEGHSRLSVAKLLQLPLVPVRVILSELSDQALKERLYMANLHRFEISKDQRLKMFADLYPDLFYNAAATIPDHIAKTMSLSSSQVRNEKQLLLLAMQQKAAKFDSNPISVADIKEARAQMNSVRRTKERLKRMQWQAVEALPLAKLPSERLPLFLSHEESSPATELDIHQAYKLISLGSSAYAIYTKDDQLVAQLDPRTFRNLAQLDAFAKELILLFHTMRKENLDL